jgi:hypothetical protein
MLKNVFVLKVTRTLLSVLKEELEILQVDKNILYKRTSVGACNDDSSDGCLKCVGTQLPV